LNPNCTDTAAMSATKTDTKNYTNTNGTSGNGTSGNGTHGNGPTEMELQEMELIITMVQIMVPFWIIPALVLLFQFNVN